ncbi:hypothetical protein SK128_010091 [Halocaridina rubra]|uniref:Alpha 1,4-glycosyltransferase domain-containing protein n=1 Tax=Halocaridina rubra TaxID=373956 RepID=A0AAN8XB92_HALRR
MQSWHKNRMWMLSEARVPAVVNDASRAMLLKLYGGTYIDLDAITLRPLPNGTNWLSRVDDLLINSAVANFRARHPFLQDITNRIPKAYHPASCCSIGPDLFTQQLAANCPENITIPTSANPDRYEYCQDIIIYPRKFFYPIHYGIGKDKLDSLFRVGEGLGPSFISTTKAYSVHLFHSLSHRRALDMKDDSILVEVAKRNCPRIFSLLLERNRTL